MAEQQASGTTRAICATNQAQAWACSDEIVGLMLKKLWRTGMLEELRAKWGISKNASENALARALYFLARIGERDKVLAEVDEYVQGWVRESGQDRVPAARLLLERMGALRLKHEVTFNVGTMSPDEYQRHLRAELADPDEAFLEALSEPGVLERLAERVRERRPMLETTGESEDE